MDEADFRHFNMNGRPEFVYRTFYGTSYSIDRFIDSACDFFHGRCIGDRWHIEFDPDLRWCDFDLHRRLAFFVRSQALTWYFSRWRAR
jgi:hypothetical protein